MTKRMAILLDVVAVLNGGAPPVVADRSFTYAIDLENAKSLIVYGGKSEKPEPIGKNEMNASHVKRRFHIHIECRAKGTAGTNADDETDALASWVVKKLGGLSKGVNDGQLYHLLIEGETEMELDQEDHQYGMVKVEIIAQYQTPANDPDTWA